MKNTLKRKKEKRNAGNIFHTKVVLINTFDGELCLGTIARCLEGLRADSVFETERAASRHA